MRKSKKYRHHNGEKKKNEMTSNDLRNIKHKTKDRVKQEVGVIPHSKGYNQKQPLALHTIVYHNHALYSILLE